jgi:hypothetical protein
MKTRLLSLAAIAVLLLNVVGFAVADTPRALAKKRQVTRLVSLLPASDGVAVFDSKRFLTDALPRILSANQPMLGQILQKIDEMQTRTGIDLRKFDQVAVGVAVKQISAKETDLEPVVIATGDVDAAALAAGARLAGKDTYREEKIGDRTVYVFIPKAAAQKTGTPVTNSKIAGMVDKALSGFTKEIAVTTLDRNTLVIGTLGRVRSTVEAKTRVAPDVIGLLSVKETSVASFAFKAPGGMSQILPLDNDALGINVDAISYLSGSLDVGSLGTSLHALARTKKAEQALELKDTLDVLTQFGRLAFRNTKRPDQQVYARMIRDAKFEVRGTDLTLDLLVAQSDIDVLIGGMK